MSILYRQCRTNEDFAQVRDLEVTIWQMGAEDAITPHGQHMLTHIGGSVWGAFDSDYPQKMIGMAVAFPMREGHQVWSHMTGVHPDYQGQGIGYQLKQVQREWALEAGYTEMRWTFDPAMRRNAHFNLTMLGATAQLYHHNFYGDMSDALNIGVPSDRLEAVWYLSETSDSEPLPDTMPMLLDSDAVVLATPHADYHRVAIPWDFGALKRDHKVLALKWRDAMQETLQSAFNAGYVVVDCLTDHNNQQAWYVLKRS